MPAVGWWSRARRSESSWRLGTRVTSLVCLLLASLVGLASAQPATPAAGRLAGRLTDGTDPLAGVTVLVSDTSASAVTDPDGRFEIGPLPPSTYQLTVLRGTLLAYVPDVTIRAGETTDVTQAITLAGRLRRDVRRHGLVPVSGARARRPGCGDVGR